MEQNNFEKKVQQKLGELQIPPSDSVWANIERRIEKKKGKRIIFVLFFVFMFLLSGGYWLFNPTKDNQYSRPVSNLIKTNSRPTVSHDPSLNKIVVSSAHNSGRHDTAGVADIKSKTSVVLPSPVFDSRSGNKRTNRKPSKLVGNAGFKSKEKMLNFSENKDVAGKQTDNEENGITSNKPYNSVIESKGKEMANPINHNRKKIYSDSLSDQLKNEKMAAEIVSKNDSSQNKHWVFGVTFSGGASLLGDGIFGIYKSNPDYFQSSPNSGGGGGIGNGGNPSFFNPSKVNNSFAFIGGAFTEKNISGKNKIALGISYKYFSLINKVGTRSSTGYSAVNTVNSYRNTFHYIEVPVGVKFQLNNSKIMPLYWQVGINISQLVSSNALQFQSSPGLYFTDNSLFNKTQFGLNTGLSVTLFSNQKDPVTIGPYFYYGASNLAGKGLYQNKHLSFVGIQAAILFKKK